MIKIGIVGENINNDSKPMRILLEKNIWKKDCQFIPILKNFEGDQLENTKKVSQEINKSIKKKKLNFVIFLRDLDARPENQEQTNIRQKWFDDINTETGKNGLFFLIIYQLEALIFSDIEVFKKKYNIKNVLHEKSKSLFIEKPKEKLKSATSKIKNKYKESHAQEIFKDLNFQKIQTNHKHPKHPCFHSFIEDLDIEIKKY